MTINKSTIIRYSRDFLFFLLASIVQTYLVCPRCNTFPKYALITFFTFLIWVFLWKGNDLLATYLSQKVSWINYPVRRFWIGLLSTIVYTLTVVFVLLNVFRIFGGVNFGSGYNYTLIFSVGITIVISLFLHGREFLFYWRKASLAAEQYEKESIAARYESLKNQVNPHFLFNTLNALTNLVYEDQDKAAKFIKQLAEVYRHVLEMRDKELVSLAEECKFLESYWYLQQIRFGHKLRLQMELSAVDSMVPPLVLQMLIENAIKHNIISEENPLTIRLYTDGKYIIVENNLQKKTLLPEESPGVGLENIRKRYAHLSSIPVEVLLQGEKFQVKLPILTLES